MLKLRPFLLGGAAVLLAALQPAWSQADRNTPPSATDATPPPAIGGNLFDEQGAGWQVAGGVSTVGDITKVVCMASRRWGAGDNVVRHIVVAAPVKSPNGVTALQIENYLLEFKNADRPGTVPGPLPAQIHLDGLKLSGNAVIGADGSLTLSVRRYAIYRPLEAALLAGRSATVTTPTAPGANLVIPGSGFRQAARLEQRCLERMLAHVALGEREPPSPATPQPSVPEADLSGTGSAAQGARGRSLGDGWNIRWNVVERNGVQTLVCIASKPMMDRRAFAISSAYRVRRNGTSERSPWMVNLAVPMPVGLHRMTMSVDNNKVGAAEAISVGQVVTLPLIADQDRILDAMRGGRTARFGMEGSANGPTWSVTLTGARRVIQDVEDCSNRLLERVVTGDSSVTEPGTKPDGAQPPAPNARPPIGGRNVFRT